MDSDKKTVVITRAKKRNWVGVNVQPDPLWIAIAQNFRTTKYGTATVVSEPGVRGEDPYHITICYGFEEKWYDVVVDLVRKTLVPQDLIVPTQDVRIYDHEPPHFLQQRKVWIGYDIVSEKLSALQKQIVALTGAVNPAEAQHQRTIPFHVTLLILQKPTVVSGSQSQ
jgi:hypothetical protein